MSPGMAVKIQIVICPCLVSRKNVRDFICSLVCRSCGVGKIVPSEDEAGNSYAHDSPLYS